ncbi:MAG TPA: 6-bladed beta-propeller [Gemmataceae bacterium]|nr:6-bladed beta-propeller [Gemmataceae bacterium]
MLNKQRFCRFLSPTSARTTRPELRMAVGLALLVLVTQSAFSETPEEAASVSIGTYGSLRLQPPTQNVRAFPRASLGAGRELEYLGTFSADAKYKKSSKFARAFEGLGSSSRSAVGLGEDKARQAEVPWRMIVPASKVVEDFDAPAHATKIAKPNSNLAGIRDGVVTFAYGRPRVMAAPYQVTTDSLLRVIISDPQLRTVHVFDPKGKTSFSILGGQGRRLQFPAGVAVDAEDNIYIADSERGLVLVYNQHGQFLRYIGKFHGENMYERPTGLAIDRKAGRLYLADTPRNLVFILDLQGNVLNRVGKDRNGNGNGEFLSPTQIAVSERGMLVLDGERSRIQILDLDGNRTGCYELVVGVDRDSGMAVDSDGNIYVSYVATSMISIYKPDGTPVGTFGQPGGRVGEFLAPRGLWVDASNRIYVADTANARVQVFQVSTGAPSPH